MIINQRGLLKRGILMHSVNFVANMAIRLLLTVSCVQSSHFGFQGGTIQKLMGCLNEKSDRFILLGA